YRHYSHHYVRHHHEESAEDSSSPAFSEIIVDANSGATLSSNNPDGLRHPASLTKIMTLYLLFERLEAGKIKLSTEMPVSDHAADQAPTKRGDKESFAKMMTAKAHALGMSHTTYVNASGLPDDDQVTTARDQALLGRAIQARFPRSFRVFSTTEFVFHGVIIHGHNHLLGSVNGVDGIKTGYIRASGFNLITS